MKMKEMLLVSTALFSLFLVTCSNPISTKSSDSNNVSVYIWERIIQGNTVLQPGWYYSTGSGDPFNDTWLTFQSDGNLVVYTKVNGQTSYASQSHTYTHTPIPDLCVFQADGNLVLYKNGTPPRPVWNSNTFNNPGATLRIREGGYCRIVASDGSELWSSKNCTNKIFPGYTFPNW